MNKTSRNFLPAETCASEHPIGILYEDDHYVVFDKPPGLLVIPTPKNERKTLVNIVNQRHTAQGKSGRLRLCHRIDRETSGAIIFAKSKRCQKLMMGLFKKRAVIKKYIALVHGRVYPARGVFKKPVHDIYRRKFRKKLSSAPAVTYYSVLETRRKFSIVEVRPVTGRTNQIRIHFRQEGHPLVGERTYAVARDYALKFRRTALHAASLEWTHPISQKRVRVRSDLPKDMAEFITRN